MPRIASLLPLLLLFGLLAQPAHAGGGIIGTAPGLAREDRVVVKFAEGTGIRLRAGHLVAGTPGVDLGGIAEILDRYPGMRIERHFTRPEAELDQDRDRGTLRSGARLPELNLYYRLVLPRASAGDAERVTEELRALRAVETAFREPIAEPAALSAPVALTTPDFRGMQVYLDAAPAGINASAVWGFPGGRGATVKLCDIEGAWQWTHEDLKAPFMTGGSQVPDIGWRNHGTAVMGELVGGNNGLGVTGIAADLQVGGISINDMSVAAAIDMAAAAGSVGDLFLIELHAPGPHATGVGQQGYVPMEWWQDNFDAIQIATANGRICIEAGGNGEENLDHPDYLGLFDRNVRFSGAIMVGAGTPYDLTAEWFTNYGSRLDLNGWGSSVTTTGYGTLQGGGEDQWYTAGFGGTSSASPIVSGAVACLQGMTKAQWGITLDASLALQILSSTGSPWVGAKRIGNRPNLSAARALLLDGVGEITGTVRDAVSHAPIEGVRIDLVESEGFALTGPGGTFSLPVLAGTFTVEGSDFFHEPGSTVVTVVAGGTAVADLDLDPKAVGSLEGTVRGAGNGPLAGAVVRVLFTPIPPATTGPSGAYTIAGIPSGAAYTAIFGLVPGKGAAARDFDVITNNTVGLNVALADAQTFELSGASFQGDAPWAWGTPSGPGPGGAFSGVRCWATNLSGNYGDNQSANLTSPSFDFSGATALYLSFTHWHNMEAGFDGGYVEVRNGGPWTIVTPIGGYDALHVDGLGGQPGFTGETDGWQPVVFDLSDHAGTPIQVRFHFASDGGINAPGWYIDDVTLDTGPSPTGVNAAVLLGDVSLQPVAPNPFEGETGIRFTLAHARGGSLAVFDASGRRVRSLLEGALRAGSTSVVWDGRDARGRAVRPGVYFVRLELDGLESRTQRLLKLR